MEPDIYKTHILGPIRSRRLGISLGVNLLPIDGKACTFDCLYCECGYNADHRGGHIADASEVILLDGPQKSLGMCFYNHGST